MYIFVNRKMCFIYHLYYNNIYTYGGIVVGCLGAGTYFLSLKKRIRT